MLPTEGSIDTSFRTWCVSRDSLRRAPLCTCRERRKRREEEEWSLDASVEAGQFSFEFRVSSPTKFRRRSRGIPGSEMELSTARFCCVLFSLVAGKFSNPRSYFDSNVLLKRQRVRSGQPCATTRTPATGFDLPFL